jgi:DNA-binding YbaB/EbfC family protein
MKNLEDIMKMAANMQAEVEKAQAALDSIEVEGVSGGGLVRVRASARGRATGLDIDASLFSADSKEMTEDLIVAAFNDARSKAEEAAGAHMQSVTANMPMPPGFKL